MLKRGPDYGRAHYQPHQPPDDPYPKTGVLPLLPAGLRGVPGGWREAAAGGRLLESRAAVRCLHGGRGAAGAARRRAAGGGAGGCHEIHQPHGGPPGRAVYRSAAGAVPAGAPGGKTISGAGGGAGSGKRGDDPADRRRLRRGRTVPAARLRGPL